MAKWVTALVVPEQVVDGQKVEGITVRIPLNEAANANEDGVMEALQYEDAIRKTAEAMLKKPRQKAKGELILKALDSMLRDKEDREKLRKVLKEKEKFANSRRPKW